jgi:hypothetical protein
MRSTGGLVKHNATISDSHLNNLDLSIASLIFPYNLEFHSNTISFVVTVCPVDSSFLFLMPFLFHALSSLKSRLRFFIDITCILMHWHGFAGFAVCHSLVMRLYSGVLWDDCWIGKKRVWSNDVLPKRLPGRTEERHRKRRLYLVYGLRFEGSTCRKLI